MRTLVASLALAAPIVLWPTPLSATDTRTCHEDQVAVWAASTQAHTRCLDIDDARTARILHRKGLR